MFNNLIRKFYVLDSITLNVGTGGSKIAVDVIATDSFEVVKQAYGSEGTATMVDENNPLPVKIGKSSTSAVTSVNDSAVSQTLLAANAARLGATFFNDSTEILYLKLGATASLTSFTVRMVANAYFEVPFGYIGIIDGVWANNAGGAARISEFTI